MLMARGYYLLIKGDVGNIPMRQLTKTKVVTKKKLLNNRLFQVNIEGFKMNQTYSIYCLITYSLKCIFWFKP